MVVKSPDWSTLNGIGDEIWRMLERGATGFRDPFHQGVLTTIGEHGPEARLVILRVVEAERTRLMCHSDVRSTKIEEIRQNPAVSWLFYHPRRKVQVRLCGTATVHTDDVLADAHWQTVGTASRINYATVQPPGTVLDRPSTALMGDLRDRLPGLVESQRFRGNFCVINCRVASMDLLKLGVLGHRRARFVRRGDEWQATWIVP